jgi:hypothetical protein
MSGHALSLAAVAFSRLQCRAGGLLRQGPELLIQEIVDKPANGNHNHRQQEYIHPFIVLYGGNCFDFFEHWATLKPVP